MAKQIYIQIPQPCHERWNEMTPTKQGAFCSSCSKNVIDFTNKTENEIYELLSKSEGSMCGRFTTFQLQQPVRKTEIENGFMNWRAIAASLAALFSFAKIADGKDTATKPVTEKVTPKTDTANIITAEEIARMPTREVCDIAAITQGAFQIDLGASIRIKQDTSNEIRGTVVDKLTGEPLGFAVVQVKETQVGVMTEENGTFVLSGEVMKNMKSPTLVVSCIGYEKMEILLSDFKENDKIRLKEMEHIKMMGVINVTRNSPFYEEGQGFVDLDRMLGRRRPGRH